MNAQNRSQLIILLICVALGVAISCYIWLRTPPATQTVPPANIAIAIGSNVTVAPTAQTNVRSIEGPLAASNGPAKEIAGIGAMLRKDNDTGAIMIAGVVPDSPAAAAGLAGTFIIRKIDNTLVDGMELQECVNLLRGSAGTPVRLELLDVDSNEARTVELTRQRIKL